MICKEAEKYGIASPIVQYSINQLKERMCGMKQGFSSKHFDDDKGNPAGGSTYGAGFTIAWQNGPLGRDENRVASNGAFVEDIIGAAIDRLEYYQSSRFACQYNAGAIDHLKSALGHCEARTIDREERQVEGTHKE